jgi:3-isopropylmalate/(R)-2-methylmalate dehydratase small subunit
MVEDDPSTVIEIDLGALCVKAGDSGWPCSLPVSARDAFLTGSWDATGLLLDEYSEVEAVAARLPYVNWSG